MIDDGTDDGTLVEATITADGDDPIAITCDDGSDETHEIGTTTGDEKLDGITTEVGTKTNDESGTEVTIDDGTVKITDDGADDGTLEYSTTTNPVVDNEMT
jgi:hypothetical protein